MNLKASPSRSIRPALKCPPITSVPGIGETSEQFAPRYR